MNKSDKGKLGENAACAELIKRGHKILERNFHRSCGEIDIISEKDGCVVFTEVKARHIDSQVSGIEAVNYPKKVKIIKTADLYLSENKTDLQPRYDIADVVLTKDDNPKVISIELYEGAFYTDGIFTVN